MRSIPLATAFLLLLIAGPAAPAPVQAPASAPLPVGNVATGKLLYMKHTCYFCHGTAGQGGIAGARLALVARNTQGFIRYVRRPSGQMPAFTEKMLSDQELTDMYAYVRQLPAARAAADIPLLFQLLPPSRPF